MHTLARTHGRRGVTLIEVMVVVTLLGLLSVAIAIAVTHQHRLAQIQATMLSATSLRSIADVWRTEHGDDVCPTAERLRQDKLVDRASKLSDAWGSPFVIECEGEDTSVLSLGPDRKAGTEDDVRAPPPDHGRVAER